MYSWDLIMDSRWTVNVQNPYATFGAYVCYYYNSGKKIHSFRQVLKKKKRLGITRNRIKSKLPKMKYKIFF